MYANPAYTRILNVPVERRIAQMLVNLERWRWLPQEVGNRFLFINIPDFSLNAVENGRVPLSMRIVVGRRHSRDPKIDYKTPVFTGRMTHLVAALVAAGTTSALGIAVLALPDPAPTLAHETAANIEATGVHNPLTAVLLAFRAVDTLLEATVVLFALIGVWSLAPDRAWGGHPGPLHRVDPQGPLAFLARVLPPIGIIVGVYIFWIGADLPGGKFQGAALIAAMWLLAIFAGLSDTPRTDRRMLRLALIAGPVVFMAVGAAGVVIAGAFLGYPEGLAKPLIVLIEWALFPSLALTLALIVAGPPARAET